MKHFLTEDSFDNETVMALISRAIEFKHGATARFSDVSVANMFFENSTRTKHSFEMAEYRLGMHAINFDATTSSTQKGESLYDSVMAMRAIGIDMVVIRHGDDGYYHELMGVKPVILNAGSGTGSHPSQSLLDMMTIFDEFGKFEGLTIGILGDIAHSRVAMSNMKLLTRLGAKVIFAGPDEYFSEACLDFGRRVSVDTLLADSDVVMLLRIQLERHRKHFKTSEAVYHALYGLNIERQKKMQPQAIIMHPGPVNRGVEISPSLIEHPQSRIFNQIENGVSMRMAILEHMIKENRIHDRT